MISEEDNIHTSGKSWDTSLPDGVCYDPDSITLEGWYTDELSAFRARRNWADTLQSQFLLEEQDFSLQVTHVAQADRYLLKCGFLSACARYAFWRLTNGQAPEAQYLIETAHIPGGESNFEDFLRAPDMREASQSGPLVLGAPGEGPLLNSNWFDWVKKLFGKMSDIE